MMGPLEVVVWSLADVLEDVIALALFRVSGEIDNKKAGCGEPTEYRLRGILIRYSFSCFCQGSASVCLKAVTGNN